MIRAHALIVGNQFSETSRKYKQAKELGITIIREDWYVPLYFCVFVFLFYFLFFIYFTYTCECARFENKNTKG